MRSRVVGVSGRHDGGSFSAVASDRNLGVRFFGKSMVATFSLMLLLTVPLLGINAQGAFAAGTGTHGYLSACTVATSADATLALHQPVDHTRKWSGGGFSECMFVSSSGMFVLFYVASTSMLSAHYGTRVTAAQELSAIQRHGLPQSLQYIGPHLHLVHDVVFGADRQDVIMLNTIAFLHGHHYVPTR